MRTGTARRAVPAALVFALLLKEVLAIESETGREGCGVGSAVRGGNKGAGLGAKVKTFQTSPSNVDGDTCRAAGFANVVVVTSVLPDDTGGASGGARSGGVEL